jgi:hypothetical protein
MDRLDRLKDRVLQVGIEGLKHPLVHGKKLEIVSPLLSIHLTI